LFVFTNALGPGGSDRWLKALRARFYLQHVIGL
jgi:hypothetical protein